MLGVLVTACGGQSGPERPQPTRSGASFSRPLELYSDVGFMTGPAQFPVVAGFSALAGPADSTWLLLAVSIPNSALRFQREGRGFLAEYDITTTFMTLDSVAVRRATGREAVRIPSFNETARTDESVIHQQGFLLRPGRYLVAVTANDANSSRGARMADTVTVPAFGVAGASLSAPLFVHEAAGRATRDSLPVLIANPRNTVAYGGTAPRLYVEAYDESVQLASVRVLDGDGASVWNGTARFDGGAGVRHAVIEIPSDSLPLGRFSVEVSAPGAVTARAPLVLTISEHWMVDNFDDVLQFLRYIATTAELDTLRTGSAVERRAAWERFWDRRDPLPVTALNEYREDFFQRVRYATEAFRESGRPGWSTDRGEVYIVLGPPDQTRERAVGRTEIAGHANAEEWIYTAVAGGRLNLLFHDRTGFGRFELVPASAAAFRSVAERLKQRAARS